MQVTVSPKFQVVIPKEIRAALGLRPSQKVEAIQYGNRIELVPVQPLTEACGFLAGSDTVVERKPDRPLTLIAAKVSLDHSLPMADTLILATTRNHDETLWTQDEDFAGIDVVRCFREGQRVTLFINAITEDPEIRGGSPIVAGTTIRVSDIAAYHLFAGLSPEQLAVQFNLRPAQVHTVLSYYSSHREEIDQEIRSNAEAAERWRLKLTGQDARRPLG